MTSWLRRRVNQLIDWRDNSRRPDQSARRQTAPGSPADELAKFAGAGAAAAAAGEDLIGKWRKRRLARLY